MQPNNSIADDLSMYVALGQSTSQIYFYTHPPQQTTLVLAGPGGGGRDAELSLIEFGDQRPIQVEMR